MEICPPEKLTNVSHFISRGLFRNYKKDAAARRAAASIFGSKKIKESVPLIPRWYLLPYEGDPVPSKQLLKRVTSL